MTTAGLPSGVVAFVVTDLEGSTRMLRRDPEAYPDVLELHHTLLDETWQRFDGVRVDRQGDGSLAAFPTARQAVLACAEAQHQLDAASWPGGLTPRVRMGVHAGWATPHDGRYVSIAVHQASRVGEAAHGGQVLISHPAAEAAGLSLRDLGRFRVRDFDQPVALHEWPDGGPFPPPRCLPAERHNLAAPGTRHVDRTDELATLARLVGEHRLVSVVGPGGVGKTRLATEWALGAAATWPDGVWLVDCMGADEPGLLAPAIARSIGLPGSDDALGAICRAFATWHAVLVLDSAERQLAEAARVGELLLTRCPGLRVLTTSTEPLHLARERVLRLAPLPVEPTATQAIPPAVELFAARSTAAVDLMDDATVRQICRRLDGLPLAVEIAAARTSALQPTEILAGLDEGLRLLRDKDPSRPPRQRALDALLEWNMDLLTPSETLALQRLSVFRSSFDLPAARAAICPADGVPPPEEVVDLIWSLVDKSLLVADPAHAGTRYRLLHTVRTHARSRLAAREEVAATVVRVGHHYAELVGPTRGTPRFWLDTIGTEVDNIRGVLGELPEAEAATAQALGIAVARYHAAVQSLRPGIAEVKTLAARWTTPGVERVGLLTALGDLHSRAGDVRQALTLARDAAALRTEVGTPLWDEVGVEKLAGEAALAHDEVAQAVAISREALDRPLTPRGRARMANLLGIALATAGEFEPAGEAFDVELAAAAETGDDVLLAHAHSNAAEIALRTARWRDAARHQRAALEIAMTLGQQGMIAFGLLTTARLATEHDPDGGWPHAVRLVARAEAMLAETGVALYSTDSKEYEQLILDARERLGADRHHALTVAGRTADPHRVVLTALDVLDAVTARRPLPTDDPTGGDLP